ncbi:MAG TPA: hypothetical protein VND65_02500 [Candidatus Binatia bacterium]|nr:hypothetical protein [Candidatus Binatia bacterium]
MARGWESKGVEAQQDEAAERKVPEKPRLSRQAADRLRETEGLRLTLQRVLQELESAVNPRHRVTLEAARGELEKKIRGLV